MAGSTVRGASSKAISAVCWVSAFTTPVPYRGWRHSHPDVQILDFQCHDSAPSGMYGKPQQRFFGCFVPAASLMLLNMANVPDAPLIVPHPPGFRPRRGLNWAFIGLLYTSFYMCRYNLSLANSAISSEFGFTKAQMGNIITTALLAYACGQIINGLLADHLGGKRAMLIGAAGTIIMNLAFGVASFWGLLWLFVVIRGIDGYVQAFGSPGMVKINAAWFRPTERGGFAGIFGFMINLGRFGIFKLGPALLAGFTFLGLIQIPPLHWRWLFWIPAGIALVVGVCMAFIVKETPEDGRLSVGQSRRRNRRASPRQSVSTCS